MLLAQLNIARMTMSLDDPRMHGFTSNLDRINSIAEADPGFVWRLKGEEEAAMFNPFGEGYLVNLSVWKDLESLHQFTYKSAQAEIMRNRKQWFASGADAPKVGMVLWWIDAQHRPSLTEAKERLDILERQGPGVHAFGFRSSFPAPLRP
jgi:hypothetical protein